MAHGHHRFGWLYVTAFVSPATGENVRYLATRVDKVLFEATLRLFAPEAGFRWWPDRATPNRPTGTRIRR